MWKGPWMKSRFFPKKDEVILSTATILIVAGLMYHGIAALFNGREHAVFQGSHIVVKK